MYRFLNEGETILASDEFLYQDTHGNPTTKCRTGWGPVWSGSVGHKTGKGALATPGRYRRRIGDPKPGVVALR